MAKARSSAGGPSEPEGANPPPGDGAGDTGEPVVPVPVVPDHAAFHASMMKKLEEVLRDNEAMRAQLQSLTRVKEESDPYEGAHGKVAEEVFVEAHGTALLVSVMSEKVSMNRDSKFKAPERKTLGNNLFRPERSVAQDFWDLRTLFERYYEWVVN